MPRKAMKTHSKSKAPSKDGKMSINPIVAGVTGAAVGAGVGVAASAALSNVKNRKKVGEALNNVRKQAMQVMENIGTKENIEEGKEVARKVLKNTTKRIGTTRTRKMNGRSQAAHA